MKTLFLLRGSFLCGIGLLVHICSKSKYTLEYKSHKRQIKICPNKKQTHPKNKHSIMIRDANLLSFLFVVNIYHNICYLKYVFAT